MSRWKVLPLALMTAAALLVSQAAAGGKSKVKPAATPEEAIANLQTAAKAGDVEGLLAQLTEPLQSYFRLQVKSEQQRDAFEDALDAKFGKDEKAFRGKSFAENLKNIPKMVVMGKEAQGPDKSVLTVWSYESREIKDKEGKATEVLRIREEKWSASRQAGAWKVLPPMGSSKRESVIRKGPDGKEVTVEVVTPRPTDDKSLQEELEWTKKVLPLLMAAQKKVFDQVQAGKYKDRAEARQAWFQAQDDVYRANPPPGSKKADEKKDEKKIEKKQ